MERTEEEIYYKNKNFTIKEEKESIYNLVEDIELNINDNEQSDVITDKTKIKELKKYIKNYKKNLKNLIKIMEV